MFTYKNTKPFELKQTNFTYLMKVKSKKQLGAAVQEVKQVVRVGSQLILSHVKWTVGQ